MADFKNKQYKLIVIDGADGSGKTTQTALLEKALAEQGAVTVFDFPRYDDSVYGKLIGRCLRGDFGDFLKLHPYISSLPFILDRAGAKEKIYNALINSTVICNRYTPSNIAHQAAKLPLAEQDDFIRFIEQGEYDELQLPRPDIVIYLAVSAEIASKLILTKNQRTYTTKAKDQHEQDISYQQKVGAVYTRLANERDDWITIDCTPEGTMLSPEEIHQLVLRAINKLPT